MSPCASVRIIVEGFPSILEALCSCRSQVSVLHLGGVYSRMEYIAVGEPLLQAFTAEHHATPGDVSSSLLVGVAATISREGHGSEAGTVHFRDGSVSPTWTIFPCSDPRVDRISVALPQLPRLMLSLSAVLARARGMAKARFPGWPGECEASYPCPGSPRADAALGATASDPGCTSQWRTSRRPFRPGIGRSDAHPRTDCPAQVIISEQAFKLVKGQFTVTEVFPEDKYCRIIKDPR